MPSTDLPFDTLKYLGDYIYEGSKSLSTQTPYSIKISIPGTDLVTAESFIPEPVKIIKATMKSPVGFDEYGDPLSEYKIQFSDPGDVKNYYELFLFAYAENNSSILSNEFLRETDPVILAEGLEDFNNNSFLFSDNLFNGGFYEMRLIFENASYGGTPVDIDVEPLKTFALLRTISPEYYNYRKNWIKHRHHQQTQPSLVLPDPILDDFVNFLFRGDVQAMETNIQNGHGIFAGYSTSIREVTRL